MLEMNVQTVYFDMPGKKNTKDTIRIAKKRAEELGIKSIILSSSGGFTAKLALNEIKLESKGHKVLFPSDYTFDHPASAWELLRRFGEGMKVAVQIVLMATEAGMVLEGEEVISMGGTGTREYPEGGGCDLSIVMEAVKGENFFNITLPPYEKKMKGRKIKEILCRPR